MSDRNSETPAPISIWRPEPGEGGETVWRRPTPTGLGDHYARRREIRGRPEPGVRRVCFFGESVAAGYLYAPHLTPAGVLERKLLEAALREAELRRRTPATADPGAAVWEVLDFSRTNERSASLAETVEAAAQLAPDHLVIFTGNNPKLLDTPELSPYAPSHAGRRELAAVLAEEGAEGLARFARRRWAGALAEALERVAAVAADLGARVTLVLPEVNLADWQTAEPPLRLPGDATARWFELLATAQRALAGALAGKLPGDLPGKLDGGAPAEDEEGGEGEDDPGGQRIREAVEAVAWEMVQLDGGLCPTPFRLLAEARKLAVGAAGSGDGSGDSSPPSPTPEAARDAALSELEATHYPLLAFLAAPRADEAARRVLAAACRRHRFAAVDLRPLFAAHTGSPLPGRRLFLDYCHLTAEGISVAMAAVAAELVGSPEEGASTEVAVPAPAAPGRSPSPAVEATACLGAAVHTAHRHLPLTGHGDLLTHWCRRALEHDADGAAAAMLDLASARLAAPPGGPELPALLAAAEERNRARPAPLLLQHGWRWPHLDGDLLRAMHAALAAAGRPEAEEIEALVARAAADPPATLELAHPPRHLATPVARPLPAAMAPEGMPHRAHLRALWPETAFDLPDPHRTWRRLRIVARRPSGAEEAGGAERGGGSEGEEAAGERPAAVVSLDGRRIGEVPLGVRWQEHTLAMADEPSAAVPPPGLRRLTVAWPPPGDAGPDPLAAAVARLGSGREAELHAVLGELFSLRLLR